MKKIALIVLAAGKSSRLGMAKQTLVLQGKTLLQRTLEAISPLNLPVFVVEGAVALEKWVAPNNSVLHNPDWQEGMASSIRCGLSALPEDTEFALFCVCDQPYLSTEILLGLIEKQQNSGQPIVACAYAGTIGVPMLIHQRFFLELRALTGDCGAKKLAQQYPNLLATFDFPLGQIDIDTPQDYEPFIP